MSLSEEERLLLVRQFGEVTGVADEERARFYLEAAGWQLQVALGGFYESEDEPPPPPPAAPTAVAAAAAGAAVASVETAAGTTGRVPPSGPQARVYGGGPMTLDALRAMMEGVDSEEEDDDDKQAFYAGGSESSGQQVLGPSGGQGKKNKLDEDIIADVFKKAREHGAEEVELGGGGRSGGPSRVMRGGASSFQGQGHKLGSEETSTAATATATAPAAAPSGQLPLLGGQREVVLRLWRGGFTVDGGGLRSYADPGNVSFLDSVKRGEVPRELIVTRGEEVSLTMEDRRGEDYTPPKTITKAFHGKGNVLGSPAPGLTPTTTVAAAGPSERAENERLAREGITLTAGAPVTNIQLRLMDGSRLVATFNHSHSVQDLHTFINTARPEYSGVGYVLSLFPSTTLSDPGKTLAEANVLNAALIQKINK